MAKRRNEEKTKVYSLEAPVLARFAGFQATAKNSSSLNRFDSSLGTLTKNFVALIHVCYKVIF